MATRTKRAPIPMKIGIQDKVADRYILQAESGSNGPVLVFDALDEQLNRQVTVQVLNVDFVRDPNGADDFLRRQVLACSMHHRSVLAVYDAGTWEGRPFSVLARRKDWSSSDGHGLGQPPDIARALEMTRGVAEALIYCRDQGLTDWTFAPGAVCLSDDGSTCIALLDGLSGPGASSDSSGDASALVGLLRLLLTGDTEATTEQLQTALLPASVVDLIARLGRAAETGAIAAPDVIRLLAEFEANANRPTEAYAPGLPSMPQEDGLAESNQLPVGYEQAPHSPGAAAEAAASDIVPIPYRPKVPATGPAERPAMTEVRPSVQKPRSRLIAVLVLATLALVVLAAAGLVATRDSPKPGTVASTSPSPPPLITVPDIRGKSSDEAGNVLATVGLTLTQTDDAYDASAPQGIVLTQDPPPDSQVPPGSVITVSVSLGPEPGESGSEQAATPAPPQPAPHRGQERGKGKKGDR